VPSLARSSLHYGLVPLVLWKTNTEILLSIYLLIISIYLLIISIYLLIISIYLLIISIYLLLLVFIS